MKSEPHVYSYDDLVADGRRTGTGKELPSKEHDARPDEGRRSRALLPLQHQASARRRCCSSRSRGLSRPHRIGSNSKYFDAKATAENPRWSMVDLAPVAPCPEVVSLEAIKSDPAFEGMLLIRRGQRCRYNRWKSTTSGVCSRWLASTWMR